MTRRVSLLVADLDVGGIQSMADSLGRGLAQRGWWPSFVCFDRIGAVGEALRGDGFEVRLVERRPGVDLALAARLRTAFRELDAEVVHAHNRTALFYGPTASRAQGPAPPRTDYASCLSFHTRCDQTDLQHKSTYSSSSDRRERSARRFARSRRTTGAARHGADCTSVQRLWRANSKTRGIRDLFSWEARRETCSSFHASCRSRGVNMLRRVLSQPARLETRGRGDSRDDYSVARSAG